jgi:hypothetical protein
VAQLLRANASLGRRPPAAAATASSLGRPAPRSFEALAERLRLKSSRAAAAAATAATAKVAYDAATPNLSEISSALLRGSASLSQPQPQPQLPPPPRGYPPPRTLRYDDPSLDDDLDPSTPSYSY